MIRADMIPDEVVEAAKTTYTAEIYKGKATLREYHEAMREAIAAALSAWPFGAVCHYTIKDTEGWELVLPLPQEARDE